MRLLKTCRWLTAFPVTKLGHSLISGVWTRWQFRRLVCSAITQLYVTHCVAFSKMWPRVRLPKRRKVMFFTSLSVQLRMLLLTPFNSLAMKSYLCVSSRRLSIDFSERCERNCAISLEDLPMSKLRTRRRTRSSDSLRKPKSFHRSMSCLDL